jgi:uncharacterized membrane protein YbhN (UPF0104 family)
MAVVVLTLAGLVLVPNVVGSRLHQAVGRLGEAQSPWLWIAGISFLATLVCNTGTWRYAFRHCGGAISRRQALAHYGLGSLVNTVSPARIGDAVRIALFSRSLEGTDRLWTSSGVFAAISAVKIVFAAALLVAASASSNIPLWPLAGASGAASILVVTALLARKRPIARHARHLFDAFRALARSPRATAFLVTWVAVGTLARVAAAAAVVAAFGLPAPLGTALVIVPVLDLAGVFPITPGNIGVTSAAVATVLKSKGIDFDTALATGLAYHAVETLASLCFGLTGALALTKLHLPRKRELALAVGASLALLGTAIVLSVIFLADLA